MNLGQGIAIGLSVLLGFNYFIGTIINRKKGTSLFRWLRDGAQAVLGKVTHASWVGSSSAGGRLAIGQANAPFRRVEMLYLLATREILPLLWLQRLRGRRDELVLKAVLRSGPRPNGRSCCRKIAAPATNFRRTVSSPARKSASGFSTTKAT